MNLKNKETELLKVREEIGELTPKIGQMYHTPKYDNEHYSSAKLDGWERQVDKLRKKELEICEEISTIKNSPEFLKEIETMSNALAAKRNKLQTDLEKVQSKLINCRWNLSDKILDGGDALILMSEIRDLEDRELLIRQAIEAITGATAVLFKMSEDIYLPRHAEAMPANQKLEIPQIQPQFQRFSD